MCRKLSRCCELRQSGRALGSQGRKKGGVVAAGAGAGTTSTSRISVICAKREPNETNKLPPCRAERPERGFDKPQVRRAARGAISSRRFDAPLAPRLLSRCPASPAQPRKRPARAATHAPISSIVVDGTETETETETAKGPFEDREQQFCTVDTCRGTWRGNVDAGAMLTSRCHGDIITFTELRGTTVRCVSSVYTFEYTEYCRRKGEPHNCALQQSLTLNRNSTRNVFRTGMPSTVHRSTPIHSPRIPQGTCARPVKTLSSTRPVRCLPCASPARSCLDVIPALAPQLIRVHPNLPSACPHPRIHLPGLSPETLSTAPLNF